VRICQVKGSVQQTKTLNQCNDVLADKNDPVKIRAVLWVTGDPCKIAVNGFNSHTVHQIGISHVDYNCYGVFKF